MERTTPPSSRSGAYSLRLPKTTDFIGCSLTSSRKHVGPGIVAHHVEVELRPGEFGPVEVRRQDALLPVLRPGQELPQRPDDAATAPDQHVLGRREPFGGIAGRQIAPLEELTRRQHEAAAFEGDVRTVGTHVSRSSTVMAQYNSTPLAYIAVRSRGM